MGEHAVADTLVLPKQLELTPALRNLIETVLPGEDRHPRPAELLQPTTLRRLLLDAGFNLVGVEGQNGALVRDLPLAGRFSRGHTSTPYRVAERFLPTLLGSQVGGFAVWL